MKKKLLYSGMVATMLFAAAEVNAQSWSLGGNAGTTGTQYLGTSDAKNLRLSTKGVTRMTINTTGNTGLGTTPVTNTRLKVFGATSAADTLAVIDATVKRTDTKDIIGVQGTSQPNPGYGIGVQGNGNFAGTFGNGGNFGAIGISGGVGVDGEATEAGNTLFLTGCQGLTSGGDVSVGVYGSAVGALNNYGIYGDQQDTAAGTDYALVGVGDAYAWRYYQASDRKLKSNIQSLEGALAKVNQLVASTYTFDHAKYPGMGLPGGKQIGFIADNVESLFPELIKTSALPTGATRDARGKVTYHSIPDVKTVNYIGLIPVLAEAIKEQKAIVDAKDAVIADLNARLTALEARMADVASAKLAATSVSGASLEQNNPNPFSQSTVIRYSIPATASSAQITIISANGSALKNYSIAAKGAGQITINANELSSGTYTYTLTVDGKIVATKSLVLTK